MREIRYTVQYGSLVVLASWLLVWPAQVDRFDRVFVAILVTLWIGPEIADAAQKLWNERATRRPPAKGGE